MTPSKILFWLCISFIVGIGFGSFFKIPLTVVRGIFVIAIILVFLYLWRKKNIFAVLGFCILFLAIGVMRFSIAELAVQHDSVRLLNDQPKKITLQGTIIDEPEIKNSLQKLKVKIEKTESIVLVVLGRSQEYRYLDVIKVTGYLKTPQEFESFSYKNYLLKDGIYSVMDFPAIEVISQKTDYTFFQFLYKEILWLKTLINSSIENQFSAPHDSLMKGILLGDDRSMPQEIKDKLTSAGVTHLTAVSGGNIVIIVTLLMATLLFVGFSRGQAFYCSVSCMWLYIIMIGFASSGVRAGIMGSLLLIAQQLGRQNTTSRTITLAAALMLLANPFLLRYDIGFQLSFASSLGIIYAKPLIDSFITFKCRFNLPKKQSKLKQFFTKKSLELRDIISMTLSAQLFTLPLVLYSFGASSVVAPLSNLLILPIIPPLMSLGFISALLGTFSHFLGWVFALPCFAFLFYFFKILDIFYQPWALASTPNLSWFFIPLYYGVMMVGLWRWQKWKKPSPLIF